MKSLIMAIAMFATAATCVLAGDHEGKPQARDTTQHVNTAPTVRIGSNDIFVTPAPRALQLVPAEPAATPAANFTLDWYSLNGGGETQASSSEWTLGSSVAQTFAGEASSSTHAMGIGFWFGDVAAACPVAMTGDVNLSGAINSADIIAMVNYVFKSGAPPQPCAAAGDVNCTGTINSADIIALVNFVFKSGAPPCDACSLIPGTWSCP